jgi:16S rRNA (adenine1518-N6/adenine1519-N6)-dimethyltransferase
MIKQKHSLGQVFLKDKKYIKIIVSTLDIKGKNVLEIGPGEGVLSSCIAQAANKLYCVEIDSRLCRLLRQKFKDTQSVEIICSDILNFPIQELNKKVVVFGNVPYYISSNLVEYLVRNRCCIRSAQLTLQKEFVHKLTAVPATKSYCALSCYVQYYADVRRRFDIPAGAFKPAPKVDSTFVSLEFYRKPLYKVEDEELLFKIINTAFSQPRKKITSLVPGVKNKCDFFSGLDIDSHARPQELSLIDYIKITQRLSANKYFLQVDI